MLRQEQNDIISWYEKYSVQLEFRHLAEEEVLFSFVGGGRGKMSRCEILRHVVNHASYHRGHIERVL